MTQPLHETPALRVLECVEAIDRARAEHAGATDPAAKAAALARTRQLETRLAWLMMEGEA